MPQIPPVGLSQGLRAGAEPAGLQGVFRPSGATCSQAGGKRLTGAVRGLAEAVCGRELGAYEAQSCAIKMIAAARANLSDLLL